MEKNEIKSDFQNDLNDGVPNISEEKTDLEAANNTNDSSIKINNENCDLNQNFVLKKEEADYFVTPNPQNNQFIMARGSFNFINQQPFSNTAFINPNNLYNSQNTWAPSICPNSIIVVYPGQNTLNLPVPISNINQLNRPAPFASIPMIPQNNLNSTANNYMPFYGHLNNTRNIYQENLLKFPMQMTQRNNFLGLPRNSFYN